MGYSETLDIELLTELVEKSDEQGYLTTEDILEALPEIDDDSLDHAEELLIALVAAGVKIYEDKEDIPDAKQLSIVAEVEEDEGEEDFNVDIADFVDIEEDPTFAFPRRDRHDLRNALLGVGFFMALFLVPMEFLFRRWQAMGIAGAVAVALLSLSG